MAHRTKKSMLTAQQRITLVIFSLLAVFAFFPQTASAHPMGNFSTNRYSRLSIDSQWVEVLHIVDMAEIPTHAERTLMDVNQDETISAKEEQQYLANKAAALSSELLLMLNGKAVELSVVEQRLSFVPGQADLPTLRMEFVLQTPLFTSGDVQELHYEDGSYAERLGWKEIIVAPSAAIALVASDVAQADISQMLQAYPIDLLQDPPNVTSATLRWQPAVAGQEGQPALQPQGYAATTTSLGGDGFADLVSIELGPWAVMLALLAAFGWGAAHALSPGHGKTIVAAYLVGARGTFAHALFLGATTTITHTLGVFVLGVATLVASQYILPERIYPWLSTISGLLVVSIGVSIGWSRLRALWRGESLDHMHDHDRKFHTHDHAHAHSHGGHSHSHMPMSESGSVTWRNLFALGVSGGLLPCPSALVVLLGAIALGRVGFGLLLILTFSLGLATVLTGFGLLLLRAGKWFERIPESGRYARYLAVASAAFITLVGVGITVRALIDTGVLSSLA